jgi:putative Mg2+ transporter-C (MgtC) family protein
MLQLLAGFNVYSITLRLILAIILGGAVGLNREDNNRPAGLRTHVLVCLGTALAMITGQYIYLHFGNVGDPSRIGAQVISGIGFLGAGTIIISGRHVQGLTTAAGLWATACMGLAIGIGFYEAAIIGGLLIIFSLVALKYLNIKLHRRSLIIQIYVELVKPENIGDLLTLIKSRSIRLLDLDWQNRNSILEGGAGVMLSLKMPKHYMHDELIELFEHQQYVLFTLNQEYNIL